MSHLKQSLMTPSAWAEVEALQEENASLRKGQVLFVFVVTEQFDNNTSTQVFGTESAAVEFFRLAAKENDAEISDDWTGDWAAADRIIDDTDNYSVFLERVKVIY